MDGSTLRFADVRLGQPVPLTAGEAASAPIADRVCDMVRRWSGASSASLVSISEEEGVSMAGDIAASVVGRHLGGSNRADVEVLLRVGEAARARAVVRVTLA